MGAILIFNSCDVKVIEPEPLVADWKFSGEIKVSGVSVNNTIDLSHSTNETFSRKTEVNLGGGVAKVSDDETYNGTYSNTSTQITYRYTKDGKSKVDVYDYKVYDKDGKTLLDLTKDGLKTTYTKQ